MYIKPVPRTTHSWGSLLQQQKQFFDEISRGTVGFYKRSYTTYHAKTNTGVSITSDESQHLSDVSLKLSFFFQKSLLDKDSSENKR